jgi:hypothetical protein
MKFKVNSRFTKSIALTAAFAFLNAIFILSSCSGQTANVQTAVQGDAIVSIASPTPTFALPDPDDEDPIANCVLDEPICVIGTGIESIDGAVYMGTRVSIELSNETFKGTEKELVLDTKATIFQEGEVVGDIEVKDRSIAQGSPDVDLILTDPAGEPKVNVVAAVDGYVFQVPRPQPYCPQPPCPQPPQSPAFSFDPATGDILIHSGGGIPLARVPVHTQTGELGNYPENVMIIEIGDSSQTNTENDKIILYDQRGSQAVMVESRDGVLFVFEPNGSQVALISPKTKPVGNVLHFLDSTGSPETALSYHEDGIFVDMGLGGHSLVVIAHMLGGSGTDFKVEEGESIILTALVPVPGKFSGKVDLNGSVEIRTKDIHGNDEIFKVSVAVTLDDFSKLISKEVFESGKIPATTPEKTSEKQNPTETPVKSAPTETSPRPSPTKAPPKPTPTPENSKVTPTPTPGK